MSILCDFVELDYFFKSKTFTRTPYYSFTIDNKDILRQRTKDIEVKRYCVNLLEKFGSFAYTRNVLEELDKKARDEVQRLGGNPLLVEVLDELMSWKHQGVQQQHRKSAL